MCMMLLLFGLEHIWGINRIFHGKFKDTILLNLKTQQASSFKKKDKILRASFHTVISLAFIIGVSMI